MQAKPPPLRASAIVPAAGSGSRFGAPQNKLLIQHAGEAVIAHTVRALGADPRVREIILVGRWEEREELLRVAQPACAPTVALRWVAGGKERRDSVLQGLLAADSSHEILLVHDGARPFLSPEVLSRVLDAAELHGAALCTLPIVDTVKRVDAQGIVQATLDRSTLHLAQTPQAFRRELGLPAYRRAVEADLPTTDDVHVFEYLGTDPHVVPVMAVAGDPRNRKLTHPGDLAPELSASKVSAAELSAEQSRTAADAMHPAASATGSYRIGTGFDLHRMVEGRPCILGGVRFDHDRGPLGHSDGDALLHALTDAVLGAAGLDDLGTHFPDTDPRWKGADSAALLKAAWTLVEQAGYALENCDLILIAERPKLAPKRAEVRARIAALLGVEVERVNLKGKTMEKLGPIGAGEAIAAQAQVLLRKLPPSPR